MGGIVANGITIKFSANTSGLTDGANQAKGMLQSFAGIAAGAGVAVASVAIGVGVATTKMAANFQSGLTSLATGAGESQKNLQMVGDGILNLATQTGTSTSQLTSGMYMIESAGYHGAAGLDVLKAAAEGARVGNADLGTVANGVTTIMTDFASSNINASQATNTLVATVANGKTTMQLLSNALSQILPTASAAGVGLNDVMGAMSTMTGEGVNANNAATYLRQTITTLSAPSKSVSDALKGIGLSANQVSEGLKTSLPATLGMITEALSKKFPAGSLAYKEALTQIAGGSKQMQGILDLTSDHLTTFKNNVTNISGAVKQGGNSITGWSQVQDTFNVKMDKAKEVLETTGIKIGQKLLPAAGQLLDKITPLITKFGDWLINSGALNTTLSLLGTGVSTLFTWLGNIVSVGAKVVDFFKNNQLAGDALKGVMAGVAAGFLAFAIVSIPAVVTGFAAMAVSAWAAAVPILAMIWPFIAIGAVVAIVVTGIILAVQHWGQIVGWLKGVWAAVSSWFMGMLGSLGAFSTGVWNGIVSALKIAWTFIVNVVKVGAALLVEAILGPFIAIGALFVWLYNHNTYFKALVDAIVNIFTSCFAWLQDRWKAVINSVVAGWQLLVGFATSLWTKVSDAVRAGIALVVSLVTGLWQKVSASVSAAWGTYIAGPLTSLWNNVSRVFSSAWNTYIAAPLAGIWKSVSKWFSDLATGASNSGKNFINMLVSGITSGAGAIWNAVTGIAKNIWKALGFHSPAEEGPASDSDTWMPNFVKMLSAGLVAGAPAIQKAANQLAMPLANNFSKPNYAALAGAKMASTVSNNQTIIVQSPDIYMDTRKVTKNVSTTQANMIRIQGGVRRH